MVSADGGEAGEGWRRVFGDKVGFLGEADIDPLQLEPLSELVDFGRQPVSIPLEDAED